MDLHERGLSQQVVLWRWPRFGRTRAHDPPGLEAADTREQFINTAGRPIRFLVTASRSAS